MSSFGALLKQLRLGAGLTQEMLARQACLSKRAIQHLERGLGQPHRDTSRRLAEALALAPDQLRLFEALAAPSPRRRRESMLSSYLNDDLISRNQKPVDQDIVSASTARGLPDVSITAAPEIRLVTVVAADIVEPARFFQALGASEAVALLDAMLRSMRSAVSRFHGSVTRIDHEGMTVLFDSRIDERESASLACRAAVAMQEAISRLSHTGTARHALLPQVRFGLASGEVVVRPVNAALSTDYTAAGLPVHLATRLARLSHPSSICLSAETMLLVEGRAEVRVCAPETSSASDQSMAVYELLVTWTDQSISQASAVPVLAPAW